MKYKMIISDFDGTLCPQTAKEVPQNVKQAINDYIAAGGKFVLCTGRMYLSIKKHAQALDLGGELLCLQGSVCCSLDTDEELFVFDIDKQTAYELAKFNEDHGWIFQFYHDLRMFTKNKNKYSDLYEEITGIGPVYTDKPVSEFALENGYSAHKMIVMTEPETASEKIKMLKDSFPMLDVSQSSPIFIEVVDKHSGKGNGVMRLCEYLNIPIEQTAILGDATNDLSMLMLNGLSCVPQNAVPEVKAVANVVFPHVNDGGAAWLINKIIADEI